MLTRVPATMVMSRALPISLSLLRKARRGWGLGIGVAVKQREERETSSVKLELTWGVIHAPAQPPRSHCASRESPDLPRAGWAVGGGESIYLMSGRVVCDRARPPPASTRGANTRAD